MEKSYRLHIYRYEEKTVIATYSYRSGNIRTLLLPEVIALEAWPKAITYNAVMFRQNVAEFRHTGEEEGNWKLAQLLMPIIAFYFLK